MDRHQCFRWWISKIATISREAVCAMILFSGGCSDLRRENVDPADGAAPEAVTIEQGPDVLRVINHEPELPPGSWTIDEVPRLQIGKIDGEEEYLFRDVVHAHRLDDGSILVVNAGGGTVVRFYSPDGKYRNGFGRQGRGPGEFWWVTAQRVSPDTILLHDATLRRSTLVTAEEGVLRTWAAPSAVTPPLYVNERAHIWVDGPVESGLPEGHHRLFRSFVLGTEEGPGTETIGHALQSEVFATSPTADGRRLWPTRVPYVLPAEYGYNWVQGFLVTNSRGADLTYFPVLERDAVPLEVVLPGRAQPVTRDDWALAVDFELNLERAVNQQRCPDCVRVRDQARRRVTPPEHMPGYDAFVFDRSGNTWARVYQSPYDDSRVQPMREWRVLAASGRWIVSSYLPRDVVPLEIGEDYMLAKITLDLDVQGVGLFDLHKR